jgi:hypothetical protein
MECWSDAPSPKSTRVAGWRCWWLGQGPARLVDGLQTKGTMLDRSGRERYMGLHLPFLRFLRLFAAAPGLIDLVGKAILRGLVSQLTVSFLVID